MKNILTRYFPTLLLLVILLPCLNTQAQLTNDLREKIEKALPEQAPVKVDKPREVLLFTLTKGFRHKSIPTGIYAITRLGEKTGCFKVTHSEDLAMFDAEKLAKFNAIIMLNTTGNLFTPDENATDAEKEKLAKRKENFETFVRDGGGLVGIHSATDTCYHWPAFGQMMGAYFDGHPWTANSQITLHVEEPSHPLCQGFEKPTLELIEEIYQFRAPYSRKALRVLTKLDTDKTNMRKRGIKRKDNDFAISWIRTFGKGHVFYCSLGHNDHIYHHPQVLKHYLAGIQYALGDLKADATPSHWIAFKAEHGYVPRFDEDGFEILFDGQDTQAWQNPEKWQVEDDKSLAWREKAGNLWTKRPYGDFILELEFKLEKDSNSGVFLRTADTKNWLHTGIEVQILDVTNKEKLDKHDCGAIYDIAAPSENALLEAGKWNKYRITAIDNLIRVELNGKTVSTIDLNQWTQAGQNPDGSKNKFKQAYKDMKRVGYIGLQDHDDPIWFRNIRIKPLNEDKAKDKKDKSADEMIHPD